MKAVKVELMMIIHEAMETLRASARHEESEEQSMWETPQVS